jgi:hypothetical protein
VIGTPIRADTPSRWRAHYGLRLTIRGLVAWSTVRGRIGHVDSSATLVGTAEAVFKSVTPIAEHRKKLIHAVLS